MTDNERSSHARRVLCGDDGRLETIRRLCHLLGDVQERLDGMASPCPCFCDERRRGPDWQSTGDALRFVEKAVRMALARDKPTPMTTDSPIVGTGYDGKITAVYHRDGATPHVPLATFSSAYDAVDWARMRFRQPYGGIRPNELPDGIEIISHDGPLVEIELAKADVETAKQGEARERAAKDAAYTERNRCVALIAAVGRAVGWTSGIGEHPKDDAAWDPEWRTIVYVDLPKGQASWHFHDRDRSLLDGLPPYARAWDGHTSEQKYERIERQVRTLNAGPVYETYRAIPEG